MVVVDRGKSSELQKSSVHSVQDSMETPGGNNADDLNLSRSSQKPQSFPSTKIIFHLKKFYCFFTVLACNFSLHFEAFFVARNDGVVFAKNTLPNSATMAL